MVKKIVGLDLGSNSIGWSVIEASTNVDKGDTIRNIVAAGSRIVPIDTSFIKEFEEGQKITKNAKRRQMRSARRMLQRYHQRREKLLSIFELIGLKNADKKFLHPAEMKDYHHEFVSLVHSGKTKPAWYPYFIRTKALYQPVSLNDIAIILYHLNQRRGYKDIGELMDEMAGIEKEETGYSKSFEIVKILDVIPENEKKGKKDLYKVELEDGRTPCITTVAALKEFIGFEKELEVRVRVTKKGEVSYELALPDNAAWQYRIDALDRKLNSSSVTPGEFFWKKLMTESHFRVKQNLVYRDKYLDEFDRIMAEQKKHHPVFADNETFHKILNIFMPNNKQERRKWQKTDLVTFIRNYIIYYQRPLKWNRNTLDTCRYEKAISLNDKSRNIKCSRNVYVMPLSHPLFQDFRLWQDIANLGFRDQYGKPQLLTIAEKEILYKEISKAGVLYFDEASKKVKEYYPKGEMTHNDIYKILGRRKEDYPELNRAEEKALMANQTVFAIRKAISKAVLSKIKNNPEQKFLPDYENLNKQTERIWHLLYSVSDIEARYKSLINKLRFSEDEAYAIKALTFQKGRCNLSAKAVRKLLPLMRCGSYYEESNVCEAAIIKINDFLNGVYKEEDTDKVMKITNNRNSVIDFQGLLYWEAAFIVYGSHTKADDFEMYQKPDDIKRFPLNTLRNPVVEQVANEALMVIKDIWATYGKPDEIVVELAREMKMTADDRKKRTEALLKEEKERKRIVKILQEEFDKPNPSRNDILKYQLYQQQNMECIYSGNKIQKSDLFSGAVQIDHILPRQRFFDDSQNNKVLTFRFENETKSKRIPYEFLGSPSRWEEFVERVNRLRKEKRISRKKYEYLLSEKIPEDFVNRQLQETRYMTVKISEKLRQVTPAVRSTIGMITDHLKQTWRVNEIFKEIQLPRFERLEMLYPEIDWIKRIKDQDGRNVLQLYGWDKRIDHRHHALDAIIIACTTLGMINQLNQLNAIYGHLSENGIPAQRFPLPFHGFYSRLKEVMNGIIVSVKCTDKLITPTINYIKKIDPVTGKYYTSKQQRDGWAIRGALHDEQPLGQLLRQEKMPITKLPDFLKKNPAALSVNENKQSVFAVKWQLDAIRKFSEYHHHDLDQMKNALKIAPLIDDYGRPIEYVTVRKKFYTKIRPVDPNLTLPQVDKIIDSRIKKDIKHLLEMNGNDPKKAFTQDNLIQMNAAKDIPVYKVKCRVDDVEIGNSNCRPTLSTKTPKDYVKFVETGENYAVVVNEEIKTGQRTFQVISFFDAVKLKIHGISLLNEKPGYISFLLRKNSLVFVPFPDDILQYDKPNISPERLYRVVKFTGKQFYFLPVSISSVIKITGIEKYKIEEFASQSCTEFFGVGKSRIKIADVCLPVSLSRLGQIIKIGLR